MELLAKAVKMHFGKKEILKGIDFTLHDKEFVGIIGPNGSGKSTFLKCLYRIQNPSAGEIYFNGRSLDELSYRESALMMAVVAQHNYYSFDFNVLEVVLMGRSPHKGILERDNKDDYAIARAALARVGMQDFEKRSFGTLSGGEQQRVILARALTQQTECLVLDEPTNHLDIKYQLEIMDIVKSLDVTVVSAIHDLNIAAMYCDRLVAIRQGEVVGVGTPKELLTEAFIQDLFGVRSVVREDEHTGSVHVMYLPAHCT